MAASAKLVDRRRRRSWPEGPGPALETSSLKNSSKTATQAAEDNQGQELGQGAREITEQERREEKLHTEYAMKRRAERVEPRIEGPWKQKQLREIPWGPLFPRQSKAGKCGKPRN